MTLSHDSSQEVRWVFAFADAHPTIDLTDVMHCASIRDVGTGLQPGAIRFFVTTLQNGAGGFAKLVQTAVRDVSDLNVTVSS